MDSYAFVRVCACVLSFPAAPNMLGRCNSTAGETFLPRKPSLEENACKSFNCQVLCLRCTQQRGLADRDAQAVLQAAKKVEDCTVCALSSMNWGDGRICARACMCMRFIFFCCAQHARKMHLNSGRNISAAQAFIRRECL